MRYYVIALFLIVIFILPWFALSYPDELNIFTTMISDRLDQLAAVIVHNPKTVAGLQSTYNVGATQGRSKLKILIVPGHSPKDGGTQHGTLKENEMTAELAQDLIGFLSDNSRYQVFTTRSIDSWNPVFETYFKNDWGEIIAWKKALKNEMTKMVRMGEYQSKEPSVIHNTAPDEVALRLYGISKWANENDIDIVLHIHFNNYPRDDEDSPGQYTGFSIYVPERQYLNSTTTKTLAQSVFKRLAKYNPVSDFPGEKKGIVEDQDLIAIGSYNSSNAASMLIEYGYIYEPQFTNPELHKLAIKDLAYQTYLGMQDFFDPTHAINLANRYDTLLLPHTWQSTGSAKDASTKDVFVLQTALIENGLYPPPPKAMNDCPRTGKIGPCTRSALEKYQENRSIRGEKGDVGPKTIDALNREYGAKAI